MPTLTDGAAMAGNAAMMAAHRAHGRLRGRAILDKDGPDERRNPLQEVRSKGTAIDSGQGVHWRRNSVTSGVDRVGKVASTHVPLLNRR